MKRYTILFINVNLRIESRPMDYGNRRGLIAFMLLGVNCKTLNVKVEVILVTHHVSNSQIRDVLKVSVV